MRKSGPRLYGIAVPAAALTAHLLGSADGAFFLTAVYLLASALSLGAIDAFQRAAAKLMSTRKVMGALLTAILLIAAGCTAFGFACLYGRDDLNRHLATWLAAGGILAVNRCFEELFASQGDPASAKLTDLLTFIALTACLLIPMEIDALGRAVCLAAGGTTLIGGCIALGFARKEPPQLNLSLFRELPAGFLRTVLFPAACITAALLSDHEAFEGLLPAAWYAGLLLLEIAKTPFKRGKFEASGLKTGVALTELLLNAAIFAAFCFLSFYWTDAASAMAALLLAGACALLLYGPFDWESLTAAAVSIAAAVAIHIGFTPETNSAPQEVLVGPAAGLILCLLMLRQWSDLARRSRANRIRKRAIKKSRSQ